MESRAGFLKEEKIAHDAEPLGKDACVSSCRLQQISDSANSELQIRRMKIQVSKIAMRRFAGLKIVLVAALRHDDFCRRDRLADMALGVIGDVHEQAGNRGGQLFLSHRATFVQLLC